MANRTDKHVRRERDLTGRHVEVVGGHRIVYARERDQRAVDRLVAMLDDLLDVPDGDV